MGDERVGRASEENNGVLSLRQPHHHHGHMPMGRSLRGVPGSGGLGGGGVTRPVKVLCLQAPCHARPIADAVCALFRSQLGVCETSSNWTGRFAREAFTATLAR